MDQRARNPVNEMNYPRGSRFAFQDEGGVNIQVLYQGVNEINIFLPGTVIVNENRIFAINFNRINVILIRETHGRHIRDELIELLIGDGLIINNILLKVIDWRNPRPIRNPETDSDNDTISYSSDSDDVSSWEEGFISENDSD